MNTSVHSLVRVSILLMFVASAILIGCGTFELGLEGRDHGREPTSPTGVTVVADVPTESSTPGLASGEPVSTATPTPARLVEASAVPTGASGPVPTVTLKPTKAATDTPTPTPRPPQPRILYFAADPSPADPLGAVELGWEVRGASSVTLQWSDPEQNSVVRSDLPLAGSLSVAAQEVKFEGGDHLRFWLLAHDAEGKVAVDAKGERVEAQLDVPLKTDLRVDAFSASPDPVQRGGTVTLTWNAPGATSVGITRLSPQGDIFLVSEAVNLPAAGSFDVVVPQNYPVSVKYYLGARDAGGVLRKAYVTVGIICPYETYLAPACPVTQDFVWAAYEPFERGHMVWRSDRLEIYVLYDDGSYEIFEDTWQEGDPVTLPGVPPSGLYGPVRGFGHLWTTQPHVQEQLGWATAEEKGYTMQVETTHGGSGRYPARASYLTVPDGRVVNLSPFHPSWQFVD